MNNREWKTLVLNRYIHEWINKETETVKEDLYSAREIMTKFMCPRQYYVHDKTHNYSMFFSCQQLNVEDLEGRVIRRTTTSHVNGKVHQKIEIK